MTGMPSVPMAIDVCVSPLESCRVVLLPEELDSLTQCVTYNPPTVLSVWEMIGRPSTPIAIEVVQPTSPVAKAVETVFPEEQAALPHFTTFKSESSKTLLM